MGKHPALTYAETHAQESVAVITQNVSTFMSLARLGLGPSLVEVNVTRSRLTLRNDTVIRVYHRDYPERMMEGPIFTAAFIDEDQILLHVPRPFYGTDIALEVIRV